MVLSFANMMQILLCFVRLSQALVVVFFYNLTNFFFMSAHVIFINLLVPGISI